MVKRVTRLAAVLSLSGIVLSHPAAQRGTPIGEWRHYAGNGASTKYSPLDRITAANVGRLEVAWQWSSPDNAIAAVNSEVRPGAYQDTPLMVNGVLYTETSLGIFVA